MAEGTKDVTTELQERTDPQPADQLLMVNPITREVQYVPLSKAVDYTGGVLAPVFTNELSDI